MLSQKFIGSRCFLFVIPAQAGIQVFLCIFWIPALTCTGWLGRNDVGIAVIELMGTARLPYGEKNFIRISRSIHN
jgi:hypothetical protein